MKLLLIGAHSYIGRYLRNYLVTRGFRVFSSVYSNFTHENDVLRCDIKIHQDIDFIFKKVNPDVTILCSALTNPKRNELYVQESLDLNVTGVANVVRACILYKSKLIFFSTDKVYSLYEENPNEESMLAPGSVYGATKFLMERYIAEVMKDFLIFRLPIVHGLGDSGVRVNSFIDSALLTVLKKQEVSVFTNIYRSFITLEDLASIVALGATTENRGIFNLGTYSKTSYFERLLDTISVVKRDDLKIMVKGEHGFADPLVQILDTSRAREVFKLEFK